MNAIEARNIRFSYNASEVIKNVSLAVAQGEFVGIIGPNGAGKSTMLRILCGILRPKLGATFIFGNNITSFNPRNLAQQIGFVPQETHFSLNYMVEDIVLMGRYPYLHAFQKEGKKDFEVMERALQSAEVFEFKNRTINSLSSGERQGVVIARALAQEPKILILDEPTSHLDLHHQFTIMELLKKLNGQGLSIIIVNHDLNLASLYCQRLVLMHYGEIYSQGTPQLIIDEKILKAVYGTEVKIISHPNKKIPQILLG